MILLFRNLLRLSTLFVLIYQLENRLRQLEGRALAKLSGSAKGKGKIEPYDSNRKQGTPGLVTAAKVLISEKQPK